jgi:hypothetical protein
LNFTKAADIVQASQPIPVSRAPQVEPELEQPEPQDTQEVQSEIENDAQPAPAENAGEIVSIIQPDVVKAFEYDPAMFRYEDEVIRPGPIISAKIKVTDAPVIDLLAQLRIGYRLGIMKIIAKACSYSMERANIRDNDSVMIVNAQANFDMHIVEDIRSVSIQQMKFRKLTDDEATSTLLTLWDLTSCGLDSFTASNVDGVNIFVHHSSDMLKLELVSHESMLDPYKVIRLMENLRDYLEKPSRYL